MRFMIKEKGGAKAQCLCIHPVSTHPSVLEELVDGSHIRWGLRVLKAVVSAWSFGRYSADRLGS